MRTSTKAKLLFAIPLLLVFAIVVVLSIRMARSSDAAAPVRTHSTAAAEPLPTYHPLRVMPPLTALQRTDDEIMQESLSPDSSAMADAERLPDAATSSAFPTIDQADSSTSSAYALAFTQELLDIDFAHSTRHELLAWASYNNAPNSLVRLPEVEQLKILPGSLTHPPTVVPTPTEWAKLATSHTTWRLSGLVISVNPIWTEMLESGWKPVDPLMVIYDVSGTLTVTTPGSPVEIESVSFALTLGGASWHLGYGAVALDYWTVN